MTITTLVEFRRILTAVELTERTNTRSAGMDYACRCLLRDHGQVILQALTTQIAVETVTEPVVTDDMMRCRALVMRFAALNPDAGEIGPGMLASLVADARAIVGESK